MTSSLSTLIFTLNFILIDICSGKRDFVVTDHAVYKGEKLEIGNQGNGSCKYTGNWKITPAWVLRNNEATYAVSAGSLLFSRFFLVVTAGHLVRRSVGRL